MAELMNEKIIYGGLVATRAETYNDALQATGSYRAADQFAFGIRVKAATPEEIAARVARGMTLANMRLAEQFKPAKYAKRSIAYSNLTAFRSSRSRRLYGVLSHR